MARLMPQNEKNKTEDKQSDFEKVVMAGVGAIVKTVEAAEDLLEDLIKKGETIFEHGKALNEELKHKKKKAGSGDSTEEADNEEEATGEEATGEKTSEEETKAGE